MFKKSTIMYVIIYLIQRTELNEKKTLLPNVLYMVCIQVLLKIGTFTT